MRWKEDLAPHAVPHSFQNIYKLYLAGVLGRGRGRRSMDRAIFRTAHHSSNPGKACCSFLERADLLMWGVHQDCQARIKDVL